MQNKINSFGELQVGQRLKMVSKRFNNATNNILIVSGDTTGLNRKLVYAVFPDRIGSWHPSEEEVKLYFQEKLESYEKRKRLLHHMFVIWDFDFNTSMEFYKN